MIMTYAQYLFASIIITVVKWSSSNVISSYGGICENIVYQKQQIV